MAESRGMERKMKKGSSHGSSHKGMSDKGMSHYGMYYDEPYAGMDPRRRREYEDSMMINEDVNAVANLPQYVKYHAWPKPGYETMYNIDDTLHGVDKQIDGDVKGMKREFDPEKY